MPNSTPNLAIPHIATNQALKEITANTAFDDLDTAMTDAQSITVTGSVDVTPAAATLQLAATFELVGTLGANINLLLPASKKFYRFHHNAANPSVGEYTITVKVSGGAGIVLQPGETRLLYCDGTNMTNATSFSVVAAPANSSAAGSPNNVAYDGTYLYVCYAPSAWARIAWDSVSF